MKIALVGKNATSKRMVAVYLRDKYKFKRMPLSDGVTRLYRALYYREKFSRVPWEKRRKIYDALYEIDNQTWVHFLEKRLATENIKPNIIVEDARYITEVKYLQQLGFVIVRIDTPDSKQRHISKALAGSGVGTVLINEYFGADLTAYKVDYSIYNDTRQGTRKAVDSLVENLTQ
jgi:DNA-directed RNA polymerase subunit F